MAPQARRWIKDHPEHVRMDYVDWWRRRGARGAGGAGCTVQPEEDRGDELVQDDDVAFFNPDWPNAPSFFRYLQQVNPRSRTREWHFFPVSDDIWHNLTVEFSIGGLVVVLIAALGTVVMTGAVLLHLCCAVEKAARTADSEQDMTLPDFTSQLLLSAENVFGIAAGSSRDFKRGGNSEILDWYFEKQTLLECIVMVMQAIANFVVYNMAAAVVVSRALRPLQQLVFAQDCVIDGEELVIRAKIVRSTVKLINASVSIQAIIHGRCVPLELARGLQGYGRWDGTNPINIRHNIDLESPLHPKNLEDPKSVLCILTCINGTDAAGLPISADCEYWNMDSPLAPVINRIKNTERKFGIRFGHMRWDCKFLDCLQFDFNSPEGAYVLMNLDHFSRLVKGVPFATLYESDTGADEAIGKGWSADRDAKQDNRKQSEVKQGEEAGTPHGSGLVSIARSASDNKAKYIEMANRMKEESEDGKRLRQLHGDN